MRIARVFPRRTNATPVDDLAFVGAPGLFPPDVEEVHVSVAFTWDIPEAQRLARAWVRVAPVRIGGPAFNRRSGQFVPGIYVKPGYTITSRGCPNNCWFCRVPKREGAVREYEICPGHDILDDNLLACSHEHMEKVFSMLECQKRRIKFTGGLEAARFDEWVGTRIRKLNPHRLYFAYDTEDDWEPLRRAAELCWDLGWTPQAHIVMAYVLVGYPKDTVPAATRRLNNVARLGIIPMAMQWRDESGEIRPEWTGFQRKWARVAITSHEIDKLKGESV